MSENEIYGVYVNLPKEFIEPMMDAIDSAMSPVYPGYRRAFSFWKMESTWTSLEGSNPYNGEPGKATYAEEWRLHFIVRKEDLPSVVSAIKRVHPYEEPGVDIVPEIPWRSVGDC